MSEYSNEQLEKAVMNYMKRKEYNRIWREKNPEKVKTMRQAYNKVKYAKEKEMREIAKKLGMM
jgi:hypothetical protein